ncbi:MAG: peptidylprolyl isomerase [Polyangiales bacterium]
MAEPAEAERANAGLLGAWRRSSDLRFYGTALIVAADVILIVTLLRAREEPDISLERPRPTQRVYLEGAEREPSQPEPATPDPHPAPLTLDEALEGVPGAGAPSAVIETSRGTLRCTLDVEHAPRGVALFIGLARGRRPYWDGVRAVWSRAPFYDGSVFFQALSGARLEGGGPTRSTATRPGFEVPVEVSGPHERGGILSLTPRATIQITASPDPSLDGQDAMIGRCQPIALVDLMTDVRAQGGRPIVPLFIRAVRIARGG